MAEETISSTPPPPPSTSSNDRPAWVQKRTRPNEDASASASSSAKQRTDAVDAESDHAAPRLGPFDVVGVRWGKHAPYRDAASGDSYPPLPYTPVGRDPVFTKERPALCLHVHATSGRARACTLHLPHGPVSLPVFMPVGTKGSVKGLTAEEMISDPALDCRIVLGNTYHLALAPGTELLEEMGGLHDFAGWNRNLLTDSGGFQMVSLSALAEISEEGVTFASPFDPNRRDTLRPEDSVAHQNRIGADVIMALDDVVSSVVDDPARFAEATRRTLRWYDRCVAAHARPREQNLFPIVQGGLDVSTAPTGLRQTCLAGLRDRDAAPGHAVGGLAGGESKDDFWRVVDACCRALPDDRPRYLMGVGHPLDLVVCSALGIDMYDCVYPTRTARFGVALVDGVAPGTLRLRAARHRDDPRPIEAGCACAACRDGGWSRSRLHELFRLNNHALAAQLVTHHNVAYMTRLTRRMHRAVLDDAYADFARSFVRAMFPGPPRGGEDAPPWVRDALRAAGVELHEPSS